MSLNWKKGDRHPPLDVVLRDQNGVVDLTSASAVEFIMQDSSGTNVVDGECTILDAASGRVRYSWAEGDTDTVGSFKAEWVVTWDDGLETTFPDDGFVTIRITKDATRSS